MLILSAIYLQAYSGTFRSDGQLLAAGGETGIVQVNTLRWREGLHVVMSIVSTSYLLSSNSIFY